MPCTALQPTSKPGQPLGVFQQYACDTLLLRKVQRAVQLYALRRQAAKLFIMGTHDSALFALPVTCFFSIALVMLLLAFG